MRKTQPTPKSNKLFTFFRVLLAVLILASTGLLLVELYSLNVLTPVLFIAAAAVLGLIDILLILFLNFKSKKTSSRVLWSVIAFLVVLVYSTGSFYIERTYHALASLSGSGERIKTTVSVIALKDSNIDTLQDLENEPVGILEGINEHGTENALKDIKDQGVTVTTKSYKNFGPLADALYGGEVDAILVNDIYHSNITNLEKFADFDSKTKIIYQCEFYTNQKNNTKPVASITNTPFTVMMNGSDSRGGLGDTDRSDVNMLVTINPKTHVVLMTSIPRDSYVETVCDPEYECLEGQYDKLTHTGIHTYNTTKATLENLLGVDINYTFRANFSAVVDIVDALGGIDVDVKPGYAVDYFWTNDMFGTNYGVHEGINHLNGQAALCYARERYAYTEGDFQRIKNQQEVLTAIAKKAISPSIITSYPRLLDTIQGNFWTDLTTNEITDLIKYQISDKPEWTFISYSLSGEPDTAYCAEAYGNASVVILDQNTVRFAKELIDAVLKGDSGEQITQMIDDKVEEAPDYGTIPNNEPAYDPDQYYAPVDDTQYYYQEPVYQTPVYQEPVYQTPVYQDPVIQDPVIQDPVVTPDPGVQDPVVNPEPETPPVQDPDPVVPVQPDASAGSEETGGQG